jgi:aminoglycoside phosphotransferase (APT) family kinase protein
MQAVGDVCFAGWKGPSNFPHDSERYLLWKSCSTAIQWDALLKYASNLNGGKGCKLLPQSRTGGCHLVHLLKFGDGTRWIVRFQLDPLSAATAIQLQSEADTMTLLQDQSKVPMPKVHGVDADKKSGVGFLSS